MRFRRQLPQRKPTTSLMPNPPKKPMAMSLLFQSRPTHLPVPAETVNPQSTGPAETSSGYSEPHVPTVVPAQTDTAISTVPSIESESLSDIAPLQSNE
ncbi:hypothetical protein DSO57_1023714 [Entomophthora muscae]|uniref:Uncharacterized protein n=1 Tax=Entomophthora muscae TaxID=34485 RepID=A0ACC2UBU4_9FUNG|nr:hypothetical protein DSO57_1023714 [Entomophthora muscae]